MKNFLRVVADSTVILTGCIGVRGEGVTNTRYSLQGLCCAYIKMDIIEILRTTDELTKNISDTKYLYNTNALNKMFICLNDIRNAKPANTSIADSIIAVSVLTGTTKHDNIRRLVRNLQKIHYGKLSPEKLAEYSKKLAEVIKDNPDKLRSEDLFELIFHLGNIHNV